ncbi:hypothetical protein [Haloarchaeobius sp. HME9146]|uniref:hypothetical protein n=1 Tax=Haloarchaeobius sp. HME9146 TaxID=2978732 RepID=UPI0021C13DC9|nr:hypothetical protein [Haloarchaeobius sp. HME9146]MCT9095161.1 hypothetical protein [Haloarchaeobius sp. HME9146]
MNVDEPFGIKASLTKSPGYTFVGRYLGIRDTAFVEIESRHELQAFDNEIANSLPEYEYEQAPESGRYSATEIWKDKNFDHSVDLYHAENRIAIEIEKSERKRVSDDLLKFINRAQAYRKKA